VPSTTRLPSRPRDSIQVLALPRFDLRGRQLLSAVAGSSIAQIVDAALPGLANRQCVRVTIGDCEILPDVWSRVRPKPGTSVVVRVVPQGGGGLRSILSLVVTIAAIAIAPALGAVLFPTLTAATATALTAFALTAVGGLAINALVPIKAPGSGSSADLGPGGQSYSISGFQNALSTGSSVPNVLGEHRFAPPYAALPYTEIVGNDQYLVALFNLGYGPLSINDVRLGDNILANFSDVEFEVREGYQTDPPVTLYPIQVIEDAIEASSAGDAGSAGTVDDPVVRTTPRDITEASIDITFPQGLVQYTGGGVPFGITVDIRVRQRLIGAHIWDDVTILSITAAERKPVRKTYRWALPQRGQYEIEVKRLTAPFNSSLQVGTSVWSALRGYRPEYPIAFDRPIALIAARIKATGQLNGVINNLNAIVKRICLDWDRVSRTWVLRATRNPASLYRYTLQSNANRFPKSDAQVNLTALAEWHEYCDDNGLEYNRIHDDAASLWDVLTDIAAAGRATPRDDGIQWTVVVDRPKTLVVAHISPRNSWGFAGERVYFKAPDGFRVTFLDETQNYRPQERVIPWPGFVGDPDVTEEIQLPGITHPRQIFRETRRRMYELLHRPDRYTVSQDFEHLVIERGDLTKVSHDVLDRTQVAARVKDVPEDNVVVLDTLVTIESGVSYAVRFRQADGETLLKRVVNPAPGDTALLVLEDGEMPEAGDLAMFGLLGTETIEAIVKDVEVSDNLAGRLTLLDHAPQIEALVNADPLPDWANV
jgi:predicted phage tail protein